MYFFLRMLDLMRPRTESLTRLGQTVCKRATLHLYAILLF